MVVFVHVKSFKMYIPLHICAVIHGGSLTSLSLSTRSARLAELSCAWLSTAERHLGVFWIFICILYSNSKRSQTKREQWKLFKVSDLVSIFREATRINLKTDCLWGYSIRNYKRTKYLISCTVL